MRVLWTVIQDEILKQAFLEDLGNEGVAVIIMTSIPSPNQSERFANLSLAREWAALERSRLIEAGWVEVST